MTNAPGHRTTDHDIAVAFAPISVAEHTTETGTTGLRAMRGERIIGGASFTFLESLLSIDPKTLDPILGAMVKHLRQRQAGREKNVRRGDRWDFWRG